MAPRVARAALATYYAGVAAVFVLVLRVWSPPRWASLLVVLLAVVLGAAVLAALLRWSRDRHSGSPRRPSETRQQP